MVLKGLLCVSSFSSLVFMIMVSDGRGHCHWSMIVMIVVVVAGAHSSSDVNAGHTFSQ